MSGGSRPSARGNGEGVRSLAGHDQTLSQTAPGLRANIQTLPNIFDIANHDYLHAFLSQRGDTCRRVLMFDSFDLPQWFFLECDQRGKWSRKPERCMLFWRRATPAALKRRSGRRWVSVCKGSRVRIWCSAGSVRSMVSLSVLLALLRGRSWRDDMAGSPSALRPPLRPRLTRC